MDTGRARAIEDAYRLYQRLRLLLRDTPRDHPARPHLLAAARAAHQHWRDLRRPPEDRVLAVAPARAYPERVAKPRDERHRGDQLG